MNVYIYSEMQNKIEKSGVGRAAYHQRRAAALNNLNCVDNMKEADVVHINTVFPKSVLAAFKAHLSGIPVVYHAHSTREDFRNSYIGSNTFSGLFKLWLKFCYSRGDLIVTPSEYSKGLLKNYGIKKEIRVISNGIDLEDYRRNEEAGKEFRVKYGYSESDKVIMSAGLMIRRKGILDFIELAKSLPQYKFIWFGSSNLNCVGKDVREAVLNKPSNLTFAGYVDKVQLQAAHSGSDLFLFPSYEETEVIVVLEALAMKTPVLLRNIPVYADWLQNGINVRKADNTEEFRDIAVKMLERELPDLTEEGYEAVKGKSLLKIGGRLYNAYLRAEYLHGGLKFAPAIHKRV